VSVDRYLMLSMIRGIVPILGLLLGLFGFLTLAEELESVGTGTFEVVDAINVMVLSLPKISLDLLPVTALVGVLVGLGTLANQQELIALRVAGWSNFRIARPAAILALLIVMIAAATQQWLIPLLEHEITDLRANTMLNTDVDGGDAQFWTRSENQLVRIGGVQFGLMPTDVEIYQLDDQGHLVQLLQAHRAVILDADSWQLYEVSTTYIGEQGTETEFQREMLWNSDLTPDQMATIVTTAAALSPTDLIRYINHLETNGLDSHRYRLVLWQQLSLPLGIFGMALLGVPFVVGSTRTMSAGSRISIGIVIGLLFYLGERTIGQLALLYSLPPVPLALGPDVLVAIIAVIALSRAR